MGDKSLNYEITNLNVHGLSSPSLRLQNRSGQPQNRQQQHAGDYSVAILSETGTLKQGSSSFVLEFRDADNQLVDVGKVEVSPVMEMSGMAPMMGGAEVTRRRLLDDMTSKEICSMGGLWKINVKFGDQPNVRFSLNAE